MIRYNSKAWGIKYSVNDLLRMKRLVLVPLAYELEETNVEKGISMKELLKRASSKLKKQAPGLEPICKYFGKALYEKITECEENVVEYRWVIISLQVMLNHETRGIRIFDLTSSRSTLPEVTISRTMEKTRLNPHS